MVAVLLLYFSSHIILVLCPRGADWKLANFSPLFKKGSDVLGKQSREILINYSSGPILGS